MKFVLRHKVLFSLAVALVHTSCILPLTEGSWFSIGSGHERYIALLHALSFGVVSCITWFVLHFAQQLRAGNTFYRTWLWHTLAIFGVLLVFLILIWPGYWRWDELDVLHASRGYVMFSWQSIFTQVQYILSIYILPFIAGIIIIQMAVIAAILGYVISHACNIVERKALVYWLLVPFLLSPAILLSYTYTLRAQLLGYLLLLFLFKVFLMFKFRQVSVQDKHVTFVGMSFLIAVLATWRSEGIFYLVFLPILWVTLGLHRDLSRNWRKTVVATFGGLAFFIICFFATQSTAQATYKLTANLNTLSVMLHDDLNQDNLKKDLADINSAINLSVLYKYPENCDTPAYWAMYSGSGQQPLVRWGKFEQNYSKYLSGMTDIFLNNPGLFAHYKLQEFLDTNYLAPHVTGRCSQSIGVGQFIPWNVKGVPAHQYAHEFATSRFGEPINATLRGKIIAAVVLQDHQSLRIVFWDVVPVLILCLLVMIHALIRRRYVWLLIMLPLFVHTGLVILSAPAAIFMYYFPVYVAGGVLSLIYIIIVVDSALHNRKIQRNPTGIIESMKSIPKPRVLVAIPAYNCEKQIPRVIAGFNRSLLGRVDKIIVIDNGSKDGTIAAAKKAAKKLGSDKLEVWKNKGNYSLGGTHKVAFLAGEKSGADYIAILHGDDQAKTAELARLIDYAETHSDTGAILGCRFMRGSTLKGYDWKRVWGNRAINVVYSIVALRPSRDLGSGLNMFRLKDLADHRYLGFDDTLTFNIDLLLDYFRKKTSLAYVPITWTEKDQVSNARNFNIGTTALKKLFRWRFGRTNFVAKKASDYQSGKV